VRGTLRFIAPTTEDEWRRADILIAELKEWDVRQSQALGFDGDEVISVFYPGDIGHIRRDSAPPEGRLLLAIDANLPVGCAAYRRVTPSACELYDVYYAPPVGVWELAQCCYSDSCGTPRLRVTAPCAWRPRRLCTMHTSSTDRFISRFAIPTEAFPASSPAQRCGWSAILAS